MQPDIAPGRLSVDTLCRHFSDAHPPLTGSQAVVEAERCFFCYDAPCIEACPTGIDIPGFIKKIQSGNLAGSARTILSSNILGGSCARVCPTDILCEGACVHVAAGDPPVAIGALQRHATDWQMQQATHPFTRAAPTGRRIAVVGAGPAGLACAHRLAMKGHDVTIYDAQDKAGGLNEYGVAAYKLADDFAQHEIAFVEQIGGITVQPGHKLGRDMTVASLTAAFDAVFLAFGQSGVRALALDNEGLPGVLNAVDFIGQIRRSPTKADVPVGRRVVVIGGGNTAIDAAVQAKRLGAETVTLLYRRGTETMSATVEEQTWARNNDVLIRTWAAPTALTATPDGAVAVTFTRGRAVDGRPVYDGAPFVLEADMVLKAVGQLVMDEPAQIGGPAIRTEGGRIAVDAFGRTSEPRVYAGGDCTAGEDLTVAAVRDGRNAAETIHADLSAVKEN